MLESIHNHILNFLYASKRYTFEYRDNSPLARLPTTIPRQDKDDSPRDKFILHRMTPTRTRGSLIPDSIHKLLVSTMALMNQRTDQWCSVEVS